MPIGLNGNYTCVASEQPVWRVRRSGFDDIVAVSIRDTYNSGVFVPEASINNGTIFRSALIIEGLLHNNNAAIQCGSLEQTGIVYSDVIFTFRVFGKTS